MHENNSLSDSEGKTILRGWPLRTQTLWDVPQEQGWWVRAHPKEQKPQYQAPLPRLREAGSLLYATYPDGMYLFMDKDQQWVDVVCIEVCGSIQNLNDKRSRYMPRLSSLLLEVGKAWLEEPLWPNQSTGKKRWSGFGTLPAQPSSDLLLPLRRLRVLYAIPNRFYEKWTVNHVPTGYEFFCRHSSLNSYNSPPMQKFLKQMVNMSQFFY